MTFRSLVAGPLLALSLASCSTVPIDTGTITQIANAAVLICGFRPLTSTIIEIWAKGNNSAQSYQAIADAICALVAPSTAARGLIARPRSAVDLTGITIYGSFVRK